MNSVSGNIILMVACAVLGVVAVCRAGDSGDVETVPFGVCLSLSGPLQDYGRINLAGVKLFMDDFNSRADAHGYRLEMLLRDDKSDPRTGAAIVEELARDHDVQFIIGPVTSEIMKAMAAKAKEYEVVLVSPEATSPELGKWDDWCFKILFSDDRQGSVLADYFIGKLGLKRAAAIINESIDYGESIFAAFQDTFEAAGGTITAVEHYDWNLDENNIPDFTGILSMVKSTKPDFVLLPGYAEDASAIILQSQAVDFAPVFCGGDGWVNDKLLLASGNNLENAYFLGTVNADSDAPPTRRFFELYDVSNDPYAQVTSLQGYDCLLLMTEAMRSGKSAHAIREALYGADQFVLASGTARFDRETGTKKSVYIFQVTRENDEFVYNVVAEILPDQ